jgi:hypothetical protein
LISSLTAFLLYQRVESLDETSQILFAAKQLASLDEILWELLVWFAGARRMGFLL